MGSKMDTLAGVSRTFSSLVEKYKLCLDRASDRIRVPAPCFRPLGFLVASGGKAYSQDLPKGYINSVTRTFDDFFDFLRFGGAPRLAFGTIF